MKLGEKNNYYWLVTNLEIVNLDKLIIEFHNKYILHLATFDSGSLTPNDEEMSQGWSSDGEIMFSPPLIDSVVIPYDQYDEWYLSKSSLNFPEKFDRFVNYNGFTLVEKETADSTWETRMKSLQNKFWEQLLLINPETLVLSGDNSIIVSKNKKLIEYIANYIR